jgi:hypothetical protein
MERQRVANEMNDPIKYMITGAAIAIVSATAAGIIVGYIVRPSPSKTLSRETIALPPALQPKPLPTASNPAQRSLPPWLQSGGTNVQRSPVLPPQAIASAQEFPAVQKAHEAYLEAQKKYVAALQAAMGGKAGTNTVQKETTKATK